MNKQEYQHIRNLAWDLIIDAHISKLPTDISAIAALYGLQDKIKSNKTLYENTLCVSQSILQIFGYEINNDYNKYLSVRLLAPMIVLKELNVQSAVDVQHFTQLPYDLAKYRYERYLMLLQRNAFRTSKLEIQVLNQFLNWIDTIIN